VKLSKGDLIIIPNYPKELKFNFYPKLGD